MTDTAIILKTTYDEIYNHLLLLRDYHKDIADHPPAQPGLAFWGAHRHSEASRKFDRLLAAMERDYITYQKMEDKE